MVQIDAGASDTTGMEGPFIPFDICVEAVPSGSAMMLQNNLMVTIAVDMNGKAGVLVTT